MNITDIEAYKRGFDRGYTLCVNRKKLKREVSAILLSIASKDFQNNYGWGLQDGYNTGKHYVKRELISQKQKEQEIEEPNLDKPIDINTTFDNIMRTQQRQAEMQQLQQQRNRENEQEIDR